MRNRPYMQIRLILLVIAIAAFATPALAQSAAIQPCEASPSPSKTAPVKTGVHSDRKLVDDSIPDDPEIEKMLAPYSAKVRALSIVLGRLDRTLKKEQVGAGSLGNFVTDGMKAYAQTKLGKPIALAIMNAGGLRKNTISEGELRASDVFELLPFENALMVVEISGANLLKLLPPLVRDAQSGARLQYKWNDQNRPEFLSGKLIDAKGHEQEIDPNKLYTIVTIDYLLKVGGGAYAVLKEAKNVTPLNITVRDAMMEYVKSETAAGRSIKTNLDGRFSRENSGEPKP